MTIPYNISCKIDRLRQADVRGGLKNQNPVLKKRFASCGCATFVLALALVVALMCVGASSAQPSSTPPPLGLSTNSATSAAHPVPPPVDITNALVSFQLKRGFRIELVAAEPLLAAPVAMSFDENGRLFVAEMPGFLDLDPTRAKPPVGRIRVLKDPEGEGVFTESTVYVSDVPWPSAVACFDGGVFVASVPDLIYFKDSAQSGTSDSRKVIFTGLGNTNSLSAQALPNNFNWGLDNRIHGAGGGIAGILTSTSTSPGSQDELAGCDFSFDPFGLGIEPEGGPSQSGLTFDSSGRKFTSDLTRPLRRPMYEPRYTARNPFYAKPPMAINAADPATTIYRASAEKPKPARGSTAPTNTPAWLSSARGGLIYRSNAFPTNYLGNYFVGDAEAHVIHRMVMRDNGLEPTAMRAPEERNTEFLISTDPLFQPVQIIAGPYGAIYIADYHGGGDHGRIYRIVPEGYETPKPPALGQAKTRELFTLLASPDGWQSDTAARLLCQRRDSAAFPWLTNMLNSALLPLSRLHALHVLDGLGRLTEAHVLKGLTDPNVWVREHAVLLSEKLAVNGVVSDSLWARLTALTTDPSPRVRYQLALTLGEIRRPDRGLVLAGLVSQEPQSPWLCSAVLSSTVDGAGQEFIALASNPRFRDSLAGQAFLRQLAIMIGTRGRLDEAGPAIDFAAHAKLDLLHTFALLAALGEGLQRTRSSLSLLDPQGTLTPIYDQAVAYTIQLGAPDAIRAEAIRLLRASPYNYDAAGDWLLAALGYREAPDTHAAAIATLARYNDPRVAPKLLGLLPAMAPPMRSETVAALLGHVTHLPAMLGAIENRRVAIDDVPQVWADFLRTFPDIAINDRAVRVFGPGFVRRPEMVQQFLPALKLKGAAARGHAIYLSRCASCHRVGFEGNALGPSLAIAAIASKEDTLKAVIEPNAHRTPGYVTEVLQTRDGRFLIGLLGDDALETVTLQQPNGAQIVWPRENTQFLNRQVWSLMPERAERFLVPQDMADLLEFLAPEQH